MTFEQNIEPLCSFLEKELKGELIIQDHIASGKLLDSIKVAVRKTASGSIIEGKSELYGRYVDSGRRAGIKKVPIDALLGWLRIKGFDLRGKKEIDIAYAIQNSIFKNGIPTNHSLKDQKTLFVTKTINKDEQTIKGSIEKTCYNFFSTDLHNIIWDTQKQLNNA